MKSIKYWPEKERPREKILNQGVGSLSDAELLAVFLRTGVKGKTAIDLARDLLNQFGTLNKLFTATLSECCEQLGIGIAKYTQLQAITELGSRLHKENIIKKDILNHVDATKKYVESQLKDLQREVFACLFLDTQNQVICFEKLFWGTLNSAAIYPREVAKRALYHNAANVIFAHNHPSGVSTPSLADKQITKQLIESLALFDIGVLDHLIIGISNITSFAEERLI